MLGDVIDEDELASGERREAVYAGSFTFVRKLGGASGVAVAGVVLQLAGSHNVLNALAAARTAELLGTAVLRPPLRTAHAPVRWRRGRQRCPPTPFLAARRSELRPWHSKRCGTRRAAGRRRDPATGIG